MSAQRNTQLASTAAQAASGNYVGAALNLFGALTGGKKTPSVLQGFDVAGTFGVDGFSGSVTAFDQKGNRWDQPLEAQWLQSLGTDVLTSGKYGVSVDGQRLRGILASTGPVQVSARVPGDSTYPQFLASSITETVAQAADMLAPKIDTAKAQAQPAAPADTAAAAFASMEQIVLLVAVAGLALYVLQDR